MNDHNIISDLIKRMKKYTLPEFIAYQLKKELSDDERELVFQGIKK